MSGTLYVMKWISSVKKNIDFDLQRATVWGKIQAGADMQGQALPTIDVLISTVGISSEMVIVTRNTKDMEVSGVQLLNS